MVNFNGKILEENTTISIHNRAYAYGDALFETLKYVGGSILFWEDHYFRLMASMRIMRMEIPMNFTMEFLDEQIKETLSANGLIDKTARVKLTVFRTEGGLYLPTQNTVSYTITVKHLNSAAYTLQDSVYEVDLFKDHYVAPTLLSTLKTNNKAINVIASIYANENKLQNCLLLNTEKQVVEALNGNIFVVKDNHVKTPLLTDGALKGVMRTQILRILNTLEGYSIVEEHLSPFELQKADELFITNVVSGIISISQYRKKAYGNTLAKLLVERLNETLGQQV